MISTFIVALCTVGAVLSIVEDRPCTSLGPNVTDASKKYHLCSSCAAGQGITLYCAFMHNQQNQLCLKDTLCSECVSGTYQDRQKHVDHCQICTPCNAEKGLQVLKTCTSVSNTVCGCAPGSYFDLTLDRCVQCARCPPGMEPSGCRNNSDTMCTPCANGTFSDGQGSCKACKSCTQEQLVQWECTAFSDTICSTPIVQYTPMLTNANEVESSDWMIYLSCSFLALIVATVVCYALWKHCYRQMDKKRTNVSLPEDASVQLYVCATRKAEDIGVQLCQIGNNATSVNIAIASEPDKDKDKEEKEKDKDNRSSGSARGASGHSKSKSNRARLNRDGDATQLQVLIDDESERTST